MILKVSSATGTKAVAHLS